MSRTRDAILADAMNLPGDERLRLADQLVQSVQGPTDPQIEAIWAAEIDRRVREIDEGTVQLVPGDAVMQRLRKIVGG